MQNMAFREERVPPDDRNECFHLVVSDLASLIDHVAASIKLIETAQAQSEPPEALPADIIVLDDVTPLYAQAGAALDGCNASLRAALQFFVENTPVEDTPAAARG